MSEEVHPQLKELCERIQERGADKGTDMKAVLIGTMDGIPIVHELGATPWEDVVTYFRTDFPGQVSLLGSTKGEAPTNPLCWWPLYLDLRGGASVSEVWDPACLELTAAKVLEGEGGGVVGLERRELVLAILFAVVAAVCLIASGKALVRWFSSGDMGIRKGEGHDLTPWASRKDNTGGLGGGGRVQGVGRHFVAETQPEGAHEGEGGGGAGDLLAKIRTPLPPGSLSSTSSTMAMSCGLGSLSLIDVPLSRSDAVSRAANII